MPIRLVLLAVRVLVSALVSIAMPIGATIIRISAEWLPTRSAEVSASEVNLGPANEIAPTGLFWYGVPSEEVSWRDELIRVAETQLGVRYHSLHYGPAGDPYGNGEGFGCAMFVSYAYNNVFFGGARADEPGNGPYYENGFAGWTQAYWSNGTGDLNCGRNVGFHEVSPEEVLPGDVVCYTSGDPYASSDNCYHVGLYYGDGQVIDSEYQGVSINDIDMSDRSLRFLSFSGSETVKLYEMSHSRM